MYMKYYRLFALLFIYGTSFAQGDLSYLKNNVYLDYYYEQPFDCNTYTEDGVNSIHDRICSNLQLQKTDSILKIYYDSVCVELGKFNSDSLILSFELLQENWRHYRNMHCDQLHGGYQTSLGAVLYMDEMRKITEIRIVEMKYLLGLYQNPY